MYNLPVKKLTGAKNVLINYKAFYTLSNIHKLERIVMEYLLLLGANQFQRERALAGAEKVFAGPIVVCSADPDSTPNNFATYTIFVKNESDPQQVMKAVQDFNSKFKAKPIYVIPLNDFVLDSSLLIANNFNCTTNGKETIKFAREKNLMKCQFKKYKVPHVESIICDNFEQAVENSKQLNDWPIVIKPVNFGGSGGVVKVNNSEEFEKAYDLTMNHLKMYATKYNSISNKILIEKYIPYKDEVSVEVLNTPGNRIIIGITKKFLGPEPYFSEIGHLASSNSILNRDFKKAIEEAAILACESLNINYGLAHVELKLNYHTLELTVVEVGARPAGDGIIDLWEKVTGKSIYALHCQSYMEKLNLSELKLSYERIAGVGYFSFSNGIITKISNTSKVISESEYIEKINIRCQVGQKTSVPKDWSTRYGFVNYLFDLQYNEIEKDDIVTMTKNVSDKIFEVRELDSDDE